MMVSHAVGSISIEEHKLSISAVGAGAPVSLHAMSGASGAGFSPLQKMTSLFNSIDTNGSGTIIKAQFNTAFATKNPPTVFKNAGADAIWAALDPGRTGSVNKDTFVSAMSGLMASLRAATPDRSSASAASSVDASLKALQVLGAPGSSNAPGALLSIKI